MNIWNINVKDVVTIGKAKTRWIVVRVGSEHAELEKERDPNTHYYGIAMRRLTKQPREQIEEPHTPTLEELRGY